MIRLVYFNFVLDAPANEPKVGYILKLDDLTIALPWLHSRYAIKKE